MKTLELSWGIADKIESEKILPSKLLKKNMEIKLVYKRLLVDLIADIIDNEKTKKYYLKSWSKSYSNYTLIESKYYNMLDILNCLGIKYELGNDSKRNGKEHDYIMVKFDGRNKYIKAIKECEKCLK